MNAEGCGGTYIAETGPDYNITRLDPYVIGKTTADGQCDENLPANPDNILTMNDGTLLIGEDAGKKKHVLDMLWMVKQELPFSFAVANSPLHLPNSIQQPWPSCADQRQCPPPIFESIARVHFLVRSS